MGIKNIIRKINSFLDRFFNLLFEYVSPGYFAIVGAIIAGGTFILSTILYSIGDPFSFFTVYISNIPIGPHGSGLVFVIGMPISVILLIPFMWAIKQWLWGHKKSGNVFLSLAFFFGVIAYGAFTAVLFFDMGTAPMIHDFASVTFFAFSLFATISLTISMEINDKASKLQWAFTSSLVTLAVTFLPWYIHTLNNWIFPFTKMDLEDWVQAMASLDPKLDGVRYFEWMGLIFVLGWIVQTGIHYHRSIIRENASMQSDTLKKSNISENLETSGVADLSTEVSDLLGEASDYGEKSEISPQSNSSEIPSE